MRHRVRRIRVWLLVAVGLTLSACDAKRDGSAGATKAFQARGVSPDVVALTLRLVGDSVWEARFESDSAPALFRVRPRVRAFGDQAPFAIVSWTLYPVAGSKPSALLAALAKIHDTPDTVTAPPRADSLRLEVAVLGVNVARAADGAFGANDTGDWISAKLFLADGEAEIYLNLDPRGGRAEFSLKDEEYGPLVLRELARVLSG